MRRNPARSSRRLGRERGATLMVALVLLLALALSGIWAFNLGTTNMRAVANMQFRQEATTAAQAAIDQTISSTLFIEQPNAVSASPVPVDLSGDGQADYIATITPAPACYKVRAVKMSELDPDRAADLACMRSSTVQNSGVEGVGAGAGDSMCADSEWNVRAEVTDAASGARVAINQGVGLRGLTTDATNSCP